MKAVTITRPGSPSVLALREADEPAHAADEILVRVRASGVNRADCMQREGNYPAPEGVPQDIPGLEYAGEVEAVGAAVRDWKPGDRVMGLVAGAGQAEKVVVHERLALPVPSNLSFEQAAAIPEVFLTAFDAVILQLGLTMGETLLIHAAGSGVGTAAVQLAKTAGARSIGTAGSDEKLAAAHVLGLDVGVNYHKQEFLQVALEETGGKGVAAILDLVGANYWTHNLEALAVRGRMIIVGLLSGRKAEADLGVILRKRLTVIGTALRSRSLEEKAAVTQSFRAHCIPLFERGAIEPIVDKVFDLEDVADAHRYMEENRNFGKIVLKIG